MFISVHRGRGFRFASAEGMCTGADMGIFYHPYLSSVFVLVIEYAEMGIFAIVLDP
jgi:hypothetical protein